MMVQVAVVLARLAVIAVQVVLVQHHLYLVLLLPMLVVAVAQVIAVVLAVLGGRVAVVLAQQAIQHQEHRVLQTQAVVLVHLVTAMQMARQEVLV
jgi:hypothetical protein